MGQRRREGERDVSGIVLLDKPAGITSNAALQTVKRLFRARKAGHTGSLDPLATGLLPICLGEATKLSGFLLDADKRYRTEIRLGVTTTTGDAEGETLRVREVADLDRARVAEAVARFTGEIEQIPPMHSALKRNGMPLYKLARQGIEVERAPRPVVIHALELVRCEADRIELDVRCSKGTYIRVLAEDIGEALGCGAHVGALRRTGVGGFDAGRMVALETLRAVAEQQGPEALDAGLVSMEDALLHWPDVRLAPDVAFFLRRGQAVFVPHAPARGFVRIYTREDRFLGIGHVLEDGRVAPKRLVNA
ncbi:MAG: tRNA pseudouridine(55) synthase TruB [Gammaproteobacteria bacterium]|nr:tRNA pseudouridine(55) synthase TruB [Gammaproteobacteria bacterium]